MGTWPLATGPQPLLFVPGIWWIQMTFWDILGVAAWWMKKLSQRVRSRCKMEKVLQTHCTSSASGLSGCTLVHRVLPEENKWWFSTAANASHSLVQFFKKWAKKHKHSTAVTGGLKRTTVSDWLWRDLKVELRVWVIIQQTESITTHPQLSSVADSEVQCTHCLTESGGLGALCYIQPDSHTGPTADSSILRGL